MVFVDGGAEFVLFLFIFVVFIIIYSFLYFIYFKKYINTRNLFIYYNIGLIFFSFLLLIIDINLTKYFIIIYSLSILLFYFFRTIKLKKNKTEILYIVLIISEPILYLSFIKLVLNVPILYYMCFKVIFLFL